MNIKLTAPTEKHLEEWVTTYIPALFNTLGIDTNGLKLIGRQMQLPSGIADLIWDTGKSINVMELKKGVIDSDCITQCMRYMMDVQTIREYALAQIRNPYIAELLEPDPEIFGTVVGSYLKDKNLLVSAKMAHINVYTYERHVSSNGIDVYLFNEVEYKMHDWGVYYGHSLNLIGDTFRERFRKNAERITADPDDHILSKNIHKITPAFVLQHEGIIPAFDENGVSQD